MCDKGCLVDIRNIKDDYGEIKTDLKEVIQMKQKQDQIIANQETRIQLLENQCFMFEKTLREILDNNQTKKDQTIKNLVKRIEEKEALEKQKVWQVKLLLISTTFGAVSTIVLTVIFLLLKLK